MKVLIDTNIILDVLCKRQGHYEDALQSACAARIKADYIITGNIKDFAKSKVPAIKPAEFLMNF